MGDKKVFYTWFDNDPNCDQFALFKRLYTITLEGSVTKKMTLECIGTLRVNEKDEWEFEGNAKESAKVFFVFD